jgi:prepilin-type N-terminal cleavage/methylation domain-containing protein
MTMSFLRERFLKDERGFTLPEMLVTTLITVFVLLGLAGIFDMSLKVFSYGTNKVEAIESARVAMEKMEREIRQASAYNKDDATNPDTHLFDRWTSSEIRFGNDRDGNGVIACPNSTGRCEKIGYRRFPDLVSGTTLGRDNTSTGATNSVANLRPVAQNVQSLAFSYYDATGNEYIPGVDEVPGVDDEACIDRVLVSLGISVDQGLGQPGTQTLTSLIDLRNREGVPDECVVL